MKTLFRIRTVTAFLSLHPKDFPSPMAPAAEEEGGGVASKVSHAAQLLQRLQQELTDAGYEVQTLRIATNPFGEWMLPFHDDNKAAATTDNAISPDDLAIAKSRLLQLNDQLTRHKIGFCAVGPAASVAEIQHCCPMIVEWTEGISCSADVAANDVSTARAAAACILAISQLPGLNGLGNFRFCATAANNKAFIPFFPGAKSSSSSQADEHGIVGFAVGLENGKLAQDLLQKAGSIQKIPTVFREGMADAVAPVQGKSDT